MLQNTSGRLLLKETLKRRFRGNFAMDATPYPIYWRKTRKSQRNVHLVIRLKLGNLLIKKLAYFQHGKSFIELQSADFIDIFEDYHKIARYRFVTDSVNATKRHHCCNQTQANVDIYQLGLATS